MEDDMKNKNYGLATVVGSSDNFKLLVEYECGYISKKDEAVYFEKAKDIITGEKLYRSGYVSIWNQKDYWNNVNKAIVTSPTKVFKASAGNYSGMIGAGLLALNRKY